RPGPDPLAARDAVGVAVQRLQATSGHDHRVDHGGETPEISGAEIDHVALGSTALHRRYAARLPASVVESRAEAGAGRPELRGRGMVGEWMPFDPTNGGPVGELPRRRRPGL
ncbi:MAG: hypothetical protein WKG07_45755, partial [Hymenobacter sp.]